MDTSESERILEAILCVLIVREGGAIRIPAQLVMDVGNAYQFHVRADRKTGDMEMVAVPVAERKKKRNGRR